MRPAMHLYYLVGFTVLALAGFLWDYRAGIAAFGIMLIGMGLPIWEQ